MDSNYVKVQNSPQFKLPPGFRFHPSDEELIVHYLRNKLVSRPLPASIVSDIDLYKYNPWELPSKASFGDEEWFFFTWRDRKYPNGSRPNRAAGSGYWKATGTDKHVVSSCGKKSIGVKKALVFYKGRPPKGLKTGWTMSEYRLLDSMIWTSTSTSTTSKSKGSMRLDDWVLCRIRRKISINHNSRMNLEDHDNVCPSNEHRNHFQRLENHDHEDLYRRSDQTSPKSETTQNLEMILDYLNKGFPMLPYISQLQLPCNMELASTSTLGFQKSCSSINYDDPNLNGVHESLFNNLIQPSKKVIDDHQEVILSSNETSRMTHSWEMGKQSRGI